jgi:hypothetical protein
MPDIETNAALGIAGNTQGSMMGSHNLLKGMASGGTDRLRARIGQGRQFKQRAALQQAMYENEDKLATRRSVLKREEMEYGSNLKRGEATQQADILDYHSTRAPEHITNTINAAREASVYEDENGNRLGEIAYKGRTAAGVVTETGGYRLPARKQEDNPNAQGQQMRQTFLGSQIPTLTSENSTTDENGHIASVGWTKRNPITNSFESNVENKDIYDTQQTLQQHGN